VNNLLLADLERDLKELIVKTLKLDGIDPADIDSEEPLFNEGLGLDSIDALELGVAIRKAYGTKIETITDEVKAHFANVRSLAKFIQTLRKE
jgi:acyl carrier protein